MEVPTCTVHNNAHDKLGNLGVCMLGFNTSDRTAQKPMFWSYSCKFSVVQRRKKQAARLHNSRSFHSSNKTRWNAVEKPNSLKTKKFKVCQSARILYLYSGIQKELPTLNSRLWVTTINANDYRDLLGQLIQAMKPHSRLWVTMINANDYRDLLGQLTDTIHRNRPGCPLQSTIPWHNHTSTQPTSYKNSYSNF